LRAYLVYPGWKKSSARLEEQPEFSKKWDVSKMAKYISRAAIAAAALAIGVSGVYAVQYGTGDLVVSVTVDPTCNITGVDPIVFSKIAKGATTTEEVKSSVIHVSCNSGGWHLSPATDFPDDVRSMTNGAASLHYKVCKPTPGTYASCTPFNQNHPIPGSDLTGSVIIYAIMEGNVLPAASGTYTDTVTISLTN
jgi:spore coat protein U-like protein